MIKYSFIVPVYNTEKYLKKCLDSLFNQTYKNFEVIVINDGSPDNSKDILLKYAKKYDNLKLIDQQNQGLSVARNNGVKSAAGQYLIFIDSDDYVEKKLLEEVDKKIGDNEVLRYQIITEDEKGKNKIEYLEESFETKKGNLALKEITNFNFVETAWCYVFERKFYLKNKFMFKKGVLHEDFGLIPYIIYKADKVCCINYLGYHYIQREGSIMSAKSYDKVIKKSYDILEMYKDIRKKIKSKDCNYDNYLLSYMANSVIKKAKDLNEKDRKEYIKDLKQLNILNDILINTFARKIKKLFMKINLNLYLRIIK